MTVEERIEKTLSFFALQSTALTQFELFWYLVQDPHVLDAHVGGRGELIDIPKGLSGTVEFAEVLAVLDKLVESGRVVTRYGYYTLSANQGILLARWKGYQQGVWREKRIRWFVSICAVIPFVRAAGLAGSQALGVVKAGSDIDLFVITDPRWLWLPRTLVTAFFHFLGIRRYGNKIARRVCLNHYLAGTKHMQEGRNWYTASEYCKLRPLFGEVYIRQFQNVNREWLQAFFPNVQFPVLHVPKNRGVQAVVEKVIAYMGGAHLEAWLGGWQSKRIHKDERHIIVTQDELSFHPKSKQDAILEAFK